jgi:benzoate-CoA ligase family protein
VQVVCETYGTQVLGITPEDRCLSAAKAFFAYGLGNSVLFPMSAGAAAVLEPSPARPEIMAERAGKYAATLFFAGPTFFSNMLRAGLPADALAGVRLAASAGEALPAALYQRWTSRFGIDILDGIGSTETLQMFISNRPGLIKPGSSGLIVPGYEAAILDEKKQPVPPGEMGDLWIRGDSICAGYWNQHEQTKATIHGDWIRTGDRYRRDEAGFYWHGGRSDDMLKVGGQWVSPIEVETALLGHAAVHECAVIGREDGDALVKPAAYVVVREGVDATPQLAAELQQFVRAVLADYKRPRWVEFVTELPRTPTGKLQRFRLREDSRT